MKHDLEDIIGLVKLLESRIIALERKIEHLTTPVMTDSWYWNH